MFGRGIRLFQVFGFEVRLDWSWLIIAGLLTWSLAQGVFPSFFPGLTPATYWWMGGAGAVGLFVSIVLHELGHSVVARGFGISMRSITLFIFGGVAEMEEHPPSAKAEFWMAVAGPAVTVVLASLFLGLTFLGNSWLWPRPVEGVLDYLGWVNVLLLAFNLVPAFPLDGGRVLRSALWAWRKNLLWATRVASWLGSLFAVLLMGWGVFSFVTGSFVGGVWYFIIGLFILNASRMSYQQALLQNALAGEPVRRIMISNPVTLQPDTSLETAVQDYFYKYPYSFYPVVKDGELLGCLTVEQVKQIPREEWTQRTVQSVAKPCSAEDTIEPNEQATKALSAMTHAHLSRLMVVDHGQLLGIVALQDLVNLFSARTQFEGA